MSDSLDTASSLSFSEEIGSVECPWVFAKNGTASRVIATLKRWVCYPLSGVIPSVIDNRRSGALLNKLMTTLVSILD